MRSEMQTNQPNQHVFFSDLYFQRQFEVLPRRSHLHCDVPEQDLSVTSYNPVGASDHVLVGGHVSIACTPQAPTPQQHVETWRWNWDPDRVVALKGALGSMQFCHQLRKFRSYQCQISGRIGITRLPTQHTCTVLTSHHDVNTSLAQVGDHGLLS